MKYLIFFLCFHAAASAVYEGPDPLKNIKIIIDISQNKALKKYTYKYRVYNPKSNNGSIKSFNIIVSRNKLDETSLNGVVYGHCSNYVSYSSMKAQEKYSYVPVGSEGPDKWTCAYADLYDEDNIYYHWGILNRKDGIGPGKVLDGFVLYSQGLPGIRIVRIDSRVDVERLPEEYNGNIDKTLELYEKVRWYGKTVGPKAPPKVFDPTKFIQYIESLLEESSKLGWVKTRGVENSLDKQLRAAEKQIGKNGNHPTQKMMEAFLKEVKNFKKKHLSPEGYALLYYNAQYFLDHLEVEKDHKDHHHDDKDHKDREHDRDRHHPHKDRHDKKHHDDHDQDRGKKYHGRK